MKITILEDHIIRNKYGITLHNNWVSYMLYQGVKSCYPGYPVHEGGPTVTPAQSNQGNCRSNILIISERKSIWSVIIHWIQTIHTTKEAFWTKFIMKGERKRRSKGKLFTPGYNSHRYSKCATGATSKVKRVLKRCSEEKLLFVQEHTENGLICNVECNGEDDNGIEMSMDLPVIDGQPTDYTSLRPLPKKTKEEEVINDNLDMNIIVHKGKMISMMNTVFKEHATYRPTCKGELYWDEERSVQWGLGWKCAMTCTNCTYMSEKYKLYNEVENGGERGPKPAAIGHGIQVGLSKQGMGNKGITEVLASANIKPPSRTTLQKKSNEVAGIVQEINEEDLKMQLEKIRDYNIAIGFEPHHPIPAEADGTFNNGLFSQVGKTPFQGATQASFTVSENLTADKKIIALKTYSKICSCPNKEKHKGNCSANLDPWSSIGNEGEYLAEAIEDINESDVTIGEITIDGDSSSRSQAPRIVQPHGVTMIPKYCVWHLRRIQERKSKGHTYSANMFKGRTKEEKKIAQQRFSFDLSNRVTAEFQAAYKSLGGNVDEMNNKMPQVVEAIIDCYRGDCGECDKHSFVCSENQRWFRPYLDVNITHKSQRCFINAEREDLDFLREVMSIRLSEAAINKTSNNSTQNKSEANNRGIKKAVPKQLTFSRNYGARAHSAVHSMNNGVGSSIGILCAAAGCPITTVSLQETIDRLDAYTKYSQNRERSHEYKLRRRAAKQEKYRQWDSRRDEKHPGYLKDGAVQDVIYIPPPDLLRRDHNYQSNRITVLSVQH